MPEGAPEINWKTTGKTSAKISAVGTKNQVIFFTIVFGSSPTERERHQSDLYQWRAHQKQKDGVLRKQYLDLLVCVKASEHRHVNHKYRHFQARYLLGDF